MIERREIQNLMNTGYADGKYPDYPKCPVCGAECETIYRSGYAVVGCDQCVTEQDAWEYAEETREEVQQ